MFLKNTQQWNQTCFFFSFRKGNKEIESQNDTEHYLEFSIKMDLELNGVEFLNLQWTGWGTCCEACVKLRTRWAQIIINPTLANVDTSNHTSDTSRKAGWLCHGTTQKQDSAVMLASTTYHRIMFQMRCKTKKKKPSSVQNYLENSSCIGSSYWSLNRGKHTTKIQTSSCHMWQSLTK